MQQLKGERVEQQSEREAPARQTGDDSEAREATIQCDRHTMQTIECDRKHLNRILGV